jgi:hypothetical protein
LTRPLRNPELVGWFLISAAIVAAALLVFRLERGLTFGWDEFVWLEIGGFAPIDQLWHPYGGHLIVVPYLLFRGVLDVFGASFAAFSVVQVLLLSFAALLLYVYGRRRVGPLLALPPPVVLLFLGGAYPVLMEPMIGIQFLSALVPGLAAIVVLEREDQLGDIAACALLCLALASFSEALPFLLGAIVSVALSPDRWRRVWVVAIPVLAYGGWRLWASQFESAGVIGSNVPLLPAYFVDALAVYSTAALGMFPIVGTGPWSLIKIDGLDFTLFCEGIVLMLIELLAVGAAVWALRRRGPIPRTLWPALAMLLTLWVELGVILIPGRTAAEPRYLYAGVLLMMLVVLELARGVRTTRVTLAIASALVVAALVGNAARFHDSRQFMVDYSTHAQADMAVIELAGKKGDQALTPNLGLPYAVSSGLVLNSGPWLLVVERYGSVAYSVPELRRQAEDVRVEADRVAVRSLRLRLDAAPGWRAGGCRRVSAAGSSDLVLPRGGAMLSASGDGATISVRRWGDRFAVQLGDLGAGRVAALRIPADRSAVPWRVQLDPTGPIEVCAMS